jgi:hypothetical protein
MTEEQFREFVLAELKCAELRAKLLTNEIAAIEIALNGNMINAETAVAWMDQANALEFLNDIGPNETGQFAPAAE